MPPPAYVQGNAVSPRMPLSSSAVQAHVRISSVTWSSRLRGRISNDPALASAPSFAKHALVSPPMFARKCLPSTDRNPAISLSRMARASMELDTFGLLHSRALASTCLPAARPCACLCHARFRILRIRFGVEGRTMVGHIPPPCPPRHNPSSFAFLCLCAF